MKTINATVTNQLLNIERSVIAVSNSVGEYQLKISFDTDWDEVDRKVITFASENGRRIAIEYDEENGVLIPWEVLANRSPKLLKVSVGAIGYSGTAERITTSSAYDGGMIFVLPEALGLSCAMTPSPDIYQKLIQEIGNLDALKTEDKDSLVSAINEIAEGGGGGTVTSVNNVLPDENGNINLTPADIDAQAELTPEQQAAVNSGITAEKVEKLEGIEAGAEANTIESISVNGTAVTPDENKNVNIPVPSYSDFVGTDGTAAGTAGLVPAPATTDAGKVLGASGRWVESMKSLTRADYNYPINNPTYVAAWLLPAGIYRVSESNTLVYTTTSDSFWGSPGNVLIVTHGGSGGDVSILHQNGNGNWKYSTAQVDGSRKLAAADLLNGTFVVNELTDSSTNKALSANMGKQLNTNIGDIANLTTTDKTSVVNAVNELARDKIKVLTSANYNYPADDPNPTAIGPWLLDSGIYKVEPDTAVRWGRNDSTTVSTGGYISVADPTDTSKPLNKTVLLLLGTAAFSITYSNNNGTASSGPISADRKQILTTADVINNLTTPTYYRPLSAAQGSKLRECIDGQTKSYTIVTTDWTALASSDPYDYQVTIASTYNNFRSTTIAELFNDNPVLFSEYGFAIASMDYQNKTITVYSIGKPSNSVTLNVNYKEPA